MSREFIRILIVLVVVFVMIMFIRSAIAAMTITNVVQLKYIWPQLIATEDGHVWVCSPNSATYLPNAQLNVPGTCAQDRVFTNSFEAK